MSRILSIQSHVVSGYVGNKAAVFPLQLLGFDVDVINSVHFSNHTGYPNGFKGEVQSGEQLLSILEGLQQNNLLDSVGHLLTGYIGSETFCRAILDVIQTLRQANSNIRYVCDPVLGDNGKLYVPQNLVSIYRNEVIPVADVVTPNQFEVEQLTGICIKNMNDAKLAACHLHDLGPSLVVITSLVFELEADNDDGSERTITVFASQRDQREDGSVKDSVWCIETPVLDGHYTGTGDICAALLLGWTAKEPGNLSSVLRKVSSTMYSLIKTTKEQSQEGSIASNELKIIQCKKIIEDPPILFEAKQIV